MNRIKLAMLASTSLYLSCGFSHAADLPVKARVAPVVISDPWVGWYAGGNIGYSWGKTDTANTVGPLDDAAPNFGSFFFPGGISSSSSKVNGGIGGVQAGYVGRIAPHWLGGVEADIQWSGQRGSGRGGFGDVTLQCTSGFCSFAGVHDVTTKLNYFGTFRGRAGVEVGNLWIYGTAGFAFGDVSVSGNTSVALFDNSVPPPVLVGGFSRAFSYSQLKGGYVGGVGIEGLIADSHWRWKLEYLHIDLGNINGGIFGAAPFVAVNTTKFIDDIVRVGLNYKFDGDKPVGAGMPVKAPPAAWLAWTGFYVGVNAGYIDSVGRSNTDALVVSTSSSPENAANLVNTSTNQFNNRSDGFLGGVQAGYNYQFSPSFVAGVEADIQGSTLRRDLNAVSTAVSPFRGASWITTTAVSNRLDYLGTVRARVGVTPTPNLMIYSTGGLAYGRVRSSTQVNFDNDGLAAPGVTSGSYSDTRVGWTAGGGFEWMFSRNWTAKIEYLYYDLGPVRYDTGGYAVDVLPTNFPGSGIASVATRTSTHFEGNIARVGLNYKFNGGPIVASY